MEYLCNTIKLKEKKELEEKIQLIVFSLLLFLVAALYLHAVYSFIFHIDSIAIIYFFL